ncbi:MAG: F0F1 ATP synthase subunit B' [Alphaproteobacteria bacterium]|nr:F0F1 ATP synthase subunit B' [Alphaproteobacteria bacterium]
MPQLVSADFLPQLVWLAIAFVALYLILNRIALPRISAVLEARENRISGDLEKAQVARDEAERVLKAYEETLSVARQKAQSSIQGVRRSIAEKSAQRQTKLNADLAKKITEAEGRIATARDTAIANVAAVATDLARAAVSRLVGQELDERTTASAVAAALKARE